MGKIPKEAKKVFTGKLFDIYQWEQELYDGSTATYEIAKRLDTVVIIGVTPDHELLIIDDEQPTRARATSFASGRLDGGEKPLEAAKREFLEETGHSSDEWEEWFSYQPYDKVEATVHYYVARNIKKTAPQSLDPGEKIDVRFMSIDDLRDEIVAGTFNAYELGTRVLRDIAGGNRAQITDFLKK